MELRDLKHFIHLFGSLNFYRTAQAMHISPSTLSRQIQRLESELGQPLFLRDNRTVTPTKTGEQFYQFAQHTLLQYQQMRHVIAERGAALCGKLHLFCSVTAAYSHLPSILDRFRASYPLVEIRLTTGDAADALEKVQSGEADLAIAGRPNLFPVSINFLPLDMVSLVLLAPSTPCPVKTQATCVNPDWSKIPFILPERGPARQSIDLWFRHQHLTNPLIYATVSGHEAIVSMVALGCGIALLPDIVLENSPEPIRKRVVKLGNTAQVPHFELGVCVQKKRLNEPVIDSFWKLLSKSNDITHDRTGPYIKSL